MEFPDIIDSASSKIRCKVLYRNMEGSPTSLQTVAKVPLIKHEFPVKSLNTYFVLRLFCEFYSQSHLKI